MDIYDIYEGTRLEHPLKKPCVEWSLAETKELTGYILEKTSDKHGGSFDVHLEHITSFEEYREYLEKACKQGLYRYWARLYLHAIYGNFEDLLLLVNEDPATIVPHVVAWRFEKGR